MDTLRTGCEVGLLGKDKHPSGTHCGKPIYRNYMSVWLCEQHFEAIQSQRIKGDATDGGIRIMEARIVNDFNFHPAAPDGPKAKQHERVRSMLKHVALDLITIVPPGREQSLMLTALEEAMHWGNAGIAKVGIDGT